MRRKESEHIDPAAGERNSAIGVRPSRRLNYSARLDSTVRSLLQRALATLLLLALGAEPRSEARAGDWPQWRGPNRDGHAPDARLPSQFQPGSLQRLWSVPVDPGYSGPIVGADRLFLLGRQDEEEVLECRECDTGRRVWSRSYPAPYKVNPAASRHGPWPKSTPSYHAGRLYCLGISSILTCLAADTGKVVWQRGLAKEVGANAEYGAAASPLVLDKLLIVPVGGQRGGSIMAFEIASGRTAWKAVPGELPAMSSPVAANLAGRRQVICFTEKQLVGLEPAAGKQLWSYPFRTAYRQNIVTPLLYNNLVIESGYMKYTFALRPSASDKGMTVQRVWLSRELRCYMSSPVLVGNYLYGQGARGELVCLDARTGKKQWSGGEFGRYCSIAVAGGRLLVLSSSGQLAVVDATPEKFASLLTYRVTDQPTWAHLAVVGDRLYVRALRELICLKWQE